MPEVAKGVVALGHSLVPRMQPPADGRPIDWLDSLLFASYRVTSLAEGYDDFGRYCIDALDKGASAVRQALYENAPQIPDEHQQEAGLVLLGSLELLGQAGGKHLAEALLYAPSLFVFRDMHDALEMRYTSERAQLAAGWVRVYREALAQYLARAARDHAVTRQPRVKA
jgi:hypothetical protein